MQQQRKDYASCSGCGLCLLVCPVWRVHHDIGLTPLARARALQHGAAAADIADSVQSCTLCAACEPVCPEDIDLVAMTLGLRRQLLQPELALSLHAQMHEQSARAPAARPREDALLVPGSALRARPATLARAHALLRGGGAIALAADDAEDVVLALEAGAIIPDGRRQRLLQPLFGLKTIVVANGLLQRQLRQWLPESKIISLGVALSGLAAVRRALRAGDLYVIEPRAYHADYQRLVKYYDALRAESGCMLNLDLQRVAIPAAPRSLAQRLGAAQEDGQAHARWILQGRKVARIVVESLEDAAVFGEVSDCPVVHLADLADDGTS